MKQHVGSDTPEDSCICCAHRREAKRHQSDPELPNVEAPATEDSVPDHEALYIDFTQVA